MTLVFPCPIDPVHQWPLHSRKHSEFPGSLWNSGTKPVDEAWCISEIAWTHKIIDTYTCTLSRQSACEYFIRFGADQFLYYAFCDTSIVYTSHTSSFTPSPPPPFSPWASLNNGAEYFKHPTDLPNNGIDFTRSPMKHPWEDCRRNLGCSCIALLHGIGPHVTPCRLCMCNLCEAMGLSVHMWQ